MEAKDAWLLFAGAFLGFVGSLLATFAAPPLSTAFGKLKSGFIERNKAKALHPASLKRDQSDRSTLIDISRTGPPGAVAQSRNWEDEIRRDPAARGQVSTSGMPAQCAEAFG